MDLVVRPASAEDLDSLATLNQVVQELHVNAEPAHFKAQVNPGEINEFFGKLLASPKTYVLIAELENKPVGYLWFELQERRATPFTVALRRIYIHHVVVAVSARGRGVGSVLLRAVESEGRVQGVTQLALDTWAFNESVQTFFSSADFKPFNIVMRKELA